MTRGQAAKLMEGKEPLIAQRTRSGRTSKTYVTDSMLKDMDKLVKSLQIEARYR